MRRQEIACIDAALIGCCARDECNLLKMKEMCPKTHWSVEVHLGTIRTRITARSPDGVQTERNIRSQDGQVDVAAALIKELCLSKGQDRLPQGTSVIVSESGALAGSADQPVVLLVTRGHQDVLVLEQAAACNRSDRSPTADLADGLRAVEISERHDAAGRCLRPLDPNALRETLRMYYRSGYRTVAISFLHSGANATHELRAADIAEGMGFKSVVLGHDAAHPRASYGERTQSAVAQARRTAALGQYGTDLSLALRTVVDVHETANTPNRPAPDFVFDIVSYEHGFIHIGADGTASRSQGPACFGNGGPLTVFDCAVVANDFSYLGIDDLDDPKRDLGLDEMIADARLCNVLRQRSSDLNVPFGSPTELARSILSQLQGTCEIAVSPQIAPGAEEWLAARLAAVLSNLEKHGCDYAGVALPDEDGFHWLACHTTSEAPRFDLKDDQGVTVTCRRFEISLAGEPVLHLYHDEAVSPKSRDRALSDLTNLVRALGSDTMAVIARRLVERREAYFLTQLNRFRTGRCEISFDDGEALIVDVKADVTQGRLVVDFSGTSQRMGTLATTQGTTLEAVRKSLMTAAENNKLMPADILAKCDISIPEQSMLNDSSADKEHSNIVAQAVVAGMLNALRNSGSSQGCVAQFMFSGVRDGTRFRSVSVLGGGDGASENEDGRSAALGPLLGQSEFDVEALEQEFPLRVEEYGLRPNSGGYGEFVGGDGVVCSIRSLEDAAFSVVSSNAMIAPFGARGGQPGARGEISVMRDMGKVERLEARDQAMLVQGDLVIMKTPGGGGFG